MRQGAQGWCTGMTQRDGMCREVGGRGVQDGKHMYTHGGLKSMYGKTHYNIVREICMQVKKQQLELDMDQQTGSKSGKEYIKAVYCHPAYLTYMQSTSCEMPDWMKHKLELRFLGEISITLDMQMTPHLWEKAKKN